MTAASVLLFLLLEPRLFNNEYFNQNESLYDNDLNIAFKVIDIIRVYVTCVSLRAFNKLYVLQLKQLMYEAFNV